MVQAGHIYSSGFGGNDDEVAKCWYGYQLPRYITTAYLSRVEERLTKWQFSKHGSGWHWLIPLLRIRGECFELTPFLVGIELVKSEKLGDRL